MIVMRIAITPSLNALSLSVRTVCSSSRLGAFGRAQFTTPAAVSIFDQITTGEQSMAGQGSAGNVIAAVCSLFVPGLGQLVQGRLGMAILQFVLAIFLWFFLLGWAVHLWSIIDAALWKPPVAVS
jgi:TM2 domain-containing membrane protein YozV